MEIFNLPNTTKVNRVVPKNAFDIYTNAKQKKLFKDLIARITWQNKLSPETVNLEGKEIREIQIFKLELKVNEEIKSLLDVIDKSIPYNIIFIVEHKEYIYLSTSVKHPHPLNEDNAVIDWTFKTEWFIPSNKLFTLQLRKSIDAVYHDFCIQLSAKPEMASRSLAELVQYRRQVDLLEKEISKLKSSITSCKQFNQKLELNLKLKAKERELSLLDCF